ncbi:MAG: circadian clock protein KaiC [Alphaproteobacteria bacterium]
MKLESGIAGFDAITNGGLPSGGVCLIEGEPGAGKSVFSTQFLVAGAEKYDSPGILISFEESEDEILNYAAGFDWEIGRLHESGRLRIVAARLDDDTIRSGSFDLQALLSIVAEHARQSGAKRIVFDGLEVLLGLLENDALERLEFYRLKEWVKQHGFACILTAHRLEGGNGADHRLMAFLPYMADCIVHLRHYLVDQVAVRTLQVSKYRGTAHRGGVYPFVIGTRGVTVMQGAPLNMDNAVSSDTVSSGVERLDAVLGGGYMRGSGILIAGEPGTAKTTLAAMFSNAACCRNEKVLFVSFDEPAAQIVRNLNSVGLDLQRHVDSGLLQFRSLRTGQYSVEEYLIELEEEIDRFKPDCMVVDPVSAIEKAKGRVFAIDPATRVVDFTRSRGITLLLTSLLEGHGDSPEQTSAHVSTIADTWVQLSYQVRAGERNRALSIVKSRGMAHSNQVRELVVENAGVRLTDVYTGGGEVLMGTARMEKEQENEMLEARYRQETAHRIRDLEESEMHLSNELDRIMKQLESRRAEIDELKASESGRRDDERETREAIFQARRGDTRGVTENG